MSDDLPSAIPEKGGDSKTVAQKPTDKEAAKPKKKFQPPKRKAKKKSRLTGLEWGGFFVDLYVTLWVWSDLIVCRDIKRLVFLLATVFVAHGVLCYFISKFLNSWWLALVVWFSLSIPATWIMYKNYQPLLTNAAESKPFVLTISNQEAPKITMEQEINQNAQRAMARHWEPPEFPQGAQGVMLTIGGNGVIFYDTLHLISQAPLMLMPGGYIVLPYLTNNRVYVKAQLPFGEAETTVKMNDEWPPKIPPGWDKNFDSKEFEMVDEGTNPVFQIRYNSPTSIEVYGVFVSENGAISIAFNGVQSARPGIPVSSIPKVKAWFKYPSTRHLGELAD